MLGVHIKVGGRDQKKLIIGELYSVFKWPQFPLIKERYNEGLLQLFALLFIYFKHF